MLLYLQLFYCYKIIQNRLLRMKKIVEKARQLQRKIIFPESDDARVLKAAAYIRENEIADPVLIGDPNIIKRKSAENKIFLPDTIEIKNWEKEQLKDKLLNIISKNLAHKNLKDDELKYRASDPLHYAGLLTAAGVADGVVAGSVATTASVIRSAIATIGLAPSSSIVSSIFLMELTDGRILTYADCGVVPYPDSNQLATIALDSSVSHKKLTGEEPRVAMLSFSTKGSARHERVELVQNACDITGKLKPDLILDGKLQFDAAFVPEIAEKKAPESPLKGRANVFIFPNLDAANISYKITERLAGAKATGPILQGLAKPYMDLSRGCNWMDIVNAACVASLLSESD